MHLGPPEHAWANRIRARFRTVEQLGTLLQAQFLPIVMLGILNFTTAGVLGPQGKGEASFAIATGTFGAAVLFLDLHVGTALAYRHRDRQALQRGLWLALALASAPAVAGVAVFVLADPAARMPGSLTRNELALTLLGLGVTTVGLYLLRTVQALGYSRHFRTGMLVQAAVYFVATLSLLPFGLTPVLIIAAWLLGACAGVVVGAKYFRELPLVASPGSRRRLLRPSLAAHVGLVGQQVLYRGDLVALGLLATTTEVGYYAVAIALAELVWTIAEAVSLATFAEGKDPLSWSARAERLAQHLSVYTKIGGVAAICVALAAPAVLFLLLPAYTPALPMILILLPGIWWGGRVRIALSAAMAADRRKLGMTLGGTGLIAGIAYVPFVAVAGAIGAAVATTLFYLAQATLATRLLRDPA